MTEETLLSLRDVVFAYPDAPPALDGISLDIRRGERIAVLGNNGAGKSTFFLVCNGILRPQSGTLFSDGKPVDDTKKVLAALRRKVGIVFQDADNQIIASTVESEISFGPMNLRLPLGEVEALVDEAVERMDLEAYRQRAPQYLSGGEKKRVSIADILAMRPEIILFDEPTASLDPKNTALLERTLEQLSALGITLVVSTHDVDFAYRFATRAVVFSAGRIVADASPGAVFADGDVVAAAGLKRPLLFEAARLVRRAFPQIPQAAPPRTLEEFARMLGLPAETDP